jgi:hypothetical protein
MTKHIVVVPGDGIGVEVTREALSVLHKITAQYGVTVTTEEHLIGGASLDTFGVPIQDQVITAAQKADAVVLGAVGGLQFEVVSHRLTHEYGVEPVLRPSRYKLARWVTADSPLELKRFIDANSHRIALDVVDAPVILATHASELKVIQERFEKVQFHALREHAGLIFQS